MTEFSKRRPAWKQVSPAPAYAVGVSAHTWKRLSIQVGRALQRLGPRGASLLRPLVPMVVQEMRLIDATWEEIERAVGHAVTQHPDFGRSNRLNVVTGREETEPLVAWMLELVRRARATEASDADAAERAEHGTVPLAQSRLGWR
jgi:hypothetical protein